VRVSGLSIDLTPSPGSSVDASYQRSIPVARTNSEFDRD
jgi:hypothetical protein